MPGDWSDERLETTYKEARAVIEAQNETMADIDDKAMRTVRLNTVLIGILLAAEEATNPSLLHPELLGIAIVGLTASVFFGLITYNESDLYVGPQGAYIEKLVADETEDPWAEDLLEMFAGMISENTGEIEWNSYLLTLTQVTLGFGIIVAILSVAI